ncbi:MAG: hypothetical protein FGM54_04390 [Chitinophagaceae bacterium]|nr:hypothetical protein [Chitinophagaceae bacterium]
MNYPVYNQPYYPEYNQPYYPEYNQQYYPEYNQYDMSNFESSENESNNTIIIIGLVLCCFLLYIVSSVIAYFYKDYFLGKIIETTKVIYSKDNKIGISSVLQSSELDYIFYNRNDNEIYCLEGIWQMELDNTGMPIETHFDNHKYKVKHYQYHENDFKLNELGITKRKYASLNEGSSPYDIFGEILINENFMPNNIDLSKYHY